MCIRDSHRGEVSRHGAGKAHEPNERGGDHQGEREGNRVGLGGGALPPQHRDDDVEEIDRRTHAARDDHQVGDSAIRLKIDTVHEAHDRYPQPAHEHELSLIHIWHAYSSSREDGGSTRRVALP